MRCHLSGFAALLAFLLEVHASFVHVDVSRDGDIAIDLDMMGKSPSRSARGQSSRPVYPARKIAHVLEDYQVDLEYEIHAGLLSESGGFLTFKNIPYAEPPIGDLRFLPPIDPQKVSENVSYGSNENVCPQVQVGWASKAADFVNDFSNISALADWKDRITPADYGPIEYPPKNVSEDCLTLDVMVPKTVWDQKNSRRIGAAVVIWIHGGGFVYGWKDQYGSPEGLFNAANKTDEDNIIYVAMNYRLGAFGWLGGPKFQEHGGIPNVGLYDQAFALQWVKNNIHLFGGSSSRMTMMGQSAGASSIMHHITAFGGRDSGSRIPSMQGAIIQSPGFFPQPNGTQDDEMYSRFLKLAKVKDVDALLTADTKVLQDANARMVHESLYGYFNFGPTIDQYYVPDLPSKILAQENFDFPAMLLGHMKLDGLLFTPPWIRTTPALLDYVRDLYPSVPQSVLDVIASGYPVPTKLGPQLALLDVADFLDDIAIQCNSFYLTEASLKSKSFKYHPVYRYVFNSLPAVHGYDTGYTYYPSRPLISPVDEKLAKFFQESIVNFVRYIDPNPEDSTFWDIYKSDDRKVMNLGNAIQLGKPDYTYSFGKDLMNRTKCEYWQSAPYFVPSTKSSDQQFVVPNQAPMEDL